MVASPLPMRRVRSPSSQGTIPRDKLGINVFPSVHVEVVNKTPVLSGSVKHHQERQIRIVIVAMIFMAQDFYMYAYASQYKH